MPDRNRRDFLRHGLLSLAALPVGTGLLSRPAWAEALPRVDPESPQAQALNYVEVADDASDHPRFEEGQTCANCRLFRAENEGCDIFPGKSVEPGGWCSAWVAKM